MHVIRVRNTEAALVTGLALLKSDGRLETSRGGPVLVAPWPVVTVTSRPEERVVLAAWRDANPFFHLVEAAWMLAGRNDAASLTPYVKRFDGFAESSGYVHGAYGHRWLMYFGFNQLDVCVNRLRRSHSDRQAVIQMWDARYDLTGDWRDRPCNTHCYLRVVEGRLDLTVCCRSNDAIWGAHGANAVHFSYLQEYLASHVGVDVGVMYQVSSNYHAYVNVYEMMMERMGSTTDPHEALDRYHRNDDVRPLPMGNSFDVDDDLPRLWSQLDAMHHGTISSIVPLKSAFARVVLRAAYAHSLHRDGRVDDSIRAAQAIEALDWRAACVEWLVRRAVAKEFAA